MIEPLPRVLIDTSAWIAALDSCGPQRARDAVRCAMELNQAVTARPIMAELLAYFEDDDRRADMKDLLESLPVARVTEKVWSRAASTAWHLRRADLAVPTMDILVTAIALTYDFRVMHRDCHFDEICSVVKLRAERA